MGYRSMASVALRAVISEPAVRSAIARSRAFGTSPKDWFSGISDETWFWINTTARRQRKEIAKLVAEMPEASLQETFTGHSGDSTLREGFNAYKLFKDRYETYVGPIHKARILDFGCGWGRIIRFFLRDVEPKNLFGIDHCEEMVRVCRDTNKWCNFELIEPFPPTSIQQESFDLIYLYSVFSHLPEEMHLAWVKEFHRLLRPDGMLIATTRDREYIEFCKNLREDPQLDAKPDWLKQSARTFVDSDSCFAAYDAGQFCYASLGAAGRWSYWGEACIPKRYIENRWKDLFDMCEYIADPKRCPQNVIIARKRS